MNNFVNKVSQYLGHKDLTHYPELYQKSNHNNDLAYSITLANYAVLYDSVRTPRSLNWKLI